MLFLRSLNPLRPGKEGPYDTFLAGLVGGYTVFGRGRQGSVNQQVLPHTSTPQVANSTRWPDKIDLDRHLRLCARHARTRQTLHPTASNSLLPRRLLTFPNLHLTRLLLPNPPLPLPLRTLPNPSWRLACLRQP
jgi:hypothetical protein